MSDSDKFVTKVVIGIIAIVGVVWGILSLFVSVPNGNVAVMVRFGKVTGEVMEAGLNMKAPIDNPVIMSVQTQLFTDNATAASKDLQDVTASVAINYKLNESQASTVYKTIGQDYISVIASPLVQETIKEVTAQYNAEDMILHRQDVVANITSELVSKLATRGIICESVNIVNFAFSAQFTQAIEAKVVAAQSVLQAQNKLQQVIIEAQQAVATANGTAQSNIVMANGQAEANAILAKSLTPEIIQYMFIQTIKNTDKVITVPGNVALTLPAPK